MKLPCRRVSKRPILHPKPFKFLKISKITHHHLVERPKSGFGAREGMSKPRFEIGIKAGSTKMAHIWPREDPNPDFVVQNKPKAIRKYLCKSSNPDQNRENHLRSKVPGGFCPSIRFSFYASHFPKTDAGIFRTYRSSRMPNPNETEHFLQQVSVGIPMVFAVSSSVNLVLVVWFFTSGLVEKTL